MEPGDYLVFKVYSDWSLKKLFKISEKPGDRYNDTMTRIRNKLINQRRNVGRIYVIQQYKFGLGCEMFRDGIGPNGWSDLKGNNREHLNLEELENVIKIVNRNKPIKASWAKVRK
jgi:hypothetical protein